MNVIFLAAVFTFGIGAHLVTRHTSRIRRRFGMSALEDEVRPALRYLGIVMMVVGGVVAGWTIRAAEG